MVELLKSLSRFRAHNDVESKVAYFKTHVPWVAPLAYLNIIYKPLPEQDLLKAIHRVNMPEPLAQFYHGCNGADLFSGALSVYGIRIPGALLNRDDPFKRLPFGIEQENRSFHPSNTSRFLGVGGYEWDGSHACIDRTDLSIWLFRRNRGTVMQETEVRWPSFEDWLSTEIVRLEMMYDETGKLLVDGSLTLPTSGPIH